MQKWLDLDVHGRVGVRVAAGAPTAPQMEAMFAPFVTTALDRVDLRVSGELETQPGRSYGEHEFEYTEDAVWIARMNVQIRRDGEGFRVNGKRELLTTVLPLVDRLAVTRDAGMIHAATVEYDGHGICMPAWGGVGKTSTIAKLVRNPRVAFMGDDWGFLSGDGELLGYAKPMFIKPHHRPIYPHLFSDKRKPLVPPALSRPISRFTTLVHPVVTQYPRVAAFSRKWSPEHMMVTPQQAFPDARVSRQAPLALLVFVERYDGSTVEFDDRSEAWMVSRLVGNFHAEMSLHSREVVTALGATGLVDTAAFFADKRDVLARAVSGKPCFLLRVPAAISADAASDLIVEHLEKAMAEAGVA